MAEAIAEQMATPKKKRSIGKLLLLVINLLLFASGAAFFVLTKFGLINSPFSSALPSAAQPAAVEGAAPAPAKAAPPVGDLKPMRLHPFVINLSGDRGRRYLRLALELSVRGNKATGDLEEQQARIRDRLIFLLSAKSYDDISSVQGKYQLQSEIVSTINEIMGAPLVEKVYFVEFIVQ